jgi:type IV pilus assembly protein PilX
MSRPVRLASRRPRAHAQQGVVLFVALIVLVVMALAGVAMMRQSGSGLSIAGNIGMKQNATSAGDLGTETAIAWWDVQRKLPGVLDSDIPAEGYFSSWGAAGDARLSGDPTRYPWGSAKQATANDGTGNEVLYIIERLCLNADQAANVAGQLCVNSPISDGTDKSGTCDHYPKSCGDDATAIHYRISSRIQGPKNTVSYTQVMVH